jgi:MraZ protein
MFLGEYVHTTDDGGRLTIPAKYRRGLENGLVITRWLDRCLVLYPMEEWERLAERVSALPSADEHARALRRLVFANASDVALDKQGRVLIPPRLRKYAGLNGEVLIAGLNTFIELWNPDIWTEERERIEGDSTTWAEWKALGI